jgi:predicted MFS family arabinose efflux permease
MLLGYTVAILGAAVATVSVLAGWVVLLVAGMALLGIGNGAAQLARYAAADLHPPERKGFVLSLVVWGGTVGAIASPALIAPTSNVAEALGITPYAGPYALALLATSSATIASLALPRRRVAVTPNHRQIRVGEIRRALRLPAVTVALAGMVAAQLAMVAVMTMTPLQLHDHGHGLDVVGWVITAHLVGMFALSPVSGRLADRIGGRMTISSGTGVLIASAALTFVAPTSHDIGLPLSLFLLGYGWNLCFVGGSSLLSRDLPEGLRIELQGVVDALVWASSAFANISAGAIYAGGSFSLLALLAGVLALVPLLVVVVQRRTGPTEPTDSQQRELEPTDSGVS